MARQLTLRQMDIIGWLRFSDFSAQGLATKARMPAPSVRRNIAALRKRGFGIVRWGRLYRITG